MKRRWPSKQLLGYLAIAAAAAAISILAGWTAIANRIDNYAYDFFFGLYPPASWTPDSGVLAIDEQTLREFGGMSHIRRTLAEGLELLAPAKPKAVAIDVILADDPGNQQEDNRLEAAMRGTPNLVLSCQQVVNGWEDPLPRFRNAAAALGHIHADADAQDGVSRRIQLEMITQRERRWALSLEAFRFSRGGAPILESPEDLEVAGVRIPARRTGDRPLLIRYPQYTPTVTVAQLKQNPSLATSFKNKTVFLGVTALTAARDRPWNPLGQSIPGVEVHRDAFETLSQGVFLTPASDLVVLLWCIVITTAAGAVFWWRGDWVAYVLGIALIMVGHFIPAWLFRNGTVFPYFASLSSAWLGGVGAATYRYFTVRRQLGKSESDRARYREAIHFVTHEMRTPLTAIQGSSELMGRYALSEDKRKQFAQMINSESKRLARMIQTFLDVERLSAGQMELKREPFPADEIINSCLDRVRPVAERKQIRIYPGEIGHDVLTGDRELMEYAVYNLLTNAVKYSPASTEVCVSAVRSGSLVRIAVRDQGIGMDAKELGNIFKKFYRTKKAEASGEVGTGIGLSIVEQIVTEHGGRMEVTSKPGHGSTFTMVLPCQSENRAAMVEEQ